MQKYVFVEKSNDNGFDVAYPFCFVPLVAPLNVEWKNVKKLLWNENKNSLLCRSGISQERQACDLFRKSLFYHVYHKIFIVSLK